MRKGALLLFILFFQIRICSLFGASEAALEHLISILRNRDSLESDDRKNLQEILSKFKAQQRLTVLEDNVIYYYIQSKNTSASRNISPVDSDFQAYKRFDGFKYSYVIEEVKEDGIVHDIFDLKDEEPVPYASWSPTELVLLFEFGELPRRNILRYAPESRAFSPLVNSQYDDFSPVFHPEGRYLVFLSNRDREYGDDQRSALYLLDLKQPFRPFKISDLGHWKPNSPSSPNSIKFLSSATLLAVAKDQESEFSMPKLITSLEEAREADRIRVKEEEEKQREAEVKEIIEEKPQTVFSVGKGLRIARIQKQNDQYSIELQETPDQPFRNIAPIPEAYLEKPRGPMLILDPPLLFYRTRQGKTSRIFLHENGKSRAISTDDEHCYGMAWNPELRLFAYLIDRNGIYYLSVISINPNEFVMRTRVEGVYSGSSQELIRIEDEDNILVRNPLGDFVKVDDTQAEAEIGVDNSTTRQINPVYEAPFQISKSLWDSSSQQKAPPEPRQLVWNTQEIEKEMENITENIRWISTSEELILLKERFNILREQVQIWIGRWDQTGDATLRTKAIRWLETINGIKVLINNAQILIEIE